MTPVSQAGTRTRHFPSTASREPWGFRRSPLPWIVLVMGLTGVAAGFLLQWWVHTRAYPLVISGKPFFAWPAFIPVTFELGILFGALGAVFGMFALNRLPMHSHPLFQSKIFERASDDAFFISIEAWDPKFDLICHRKTAGVAGRAARRARGVLIHVTSRERRATPRTGHDPARALVEPHSDDRRGRRAPGRDRLRRPRRSGTRSSSCSPGSCRSCSS